MDSTIAAGLRLHLAALDEPRNPYDHGRAHHQARAYLAQNLLSQGRSVEEQVFSTTSDGEGINIIGSPPSAREPTHLLVAHYDTVTDSPGADDNTSAVAVALEVSARCPRIAVLFPDLEERNLRGSRHFVAQKVWPKVPTLVLESVGFWSHEPCSQQYPDILSVAFPQVFERLKTREFRGNFLAHLYLSDQAALAQEFEIFLGDSVIDISIPKGALQGPGGEILKDFGRSDHLAFWEAGRVCSMLTDSANFRNPNYHQPSDTAVTLDFGRMEWLVQQLVSYFQ